MQQVQIVITAIICIICFVGGLFVLLSNYRRRANRIVFYLTTVAALSLPAQGIMVYIDPENVLFWARIDTSTTMLLDFLTLLMACNFPRRLFSAKVEIPFGLFAVAMAIISFMPSMVSGATLDNNNTVQLTTGELMPLYYVVDAFYTFLIIPAMIVQYMRGRKIDKMRIKYLLLGIGGIALMTSIVGLWLPIFFQIYEAVYLVPFAILIGGAFIMYDVVALRLLSIRLVVARSVAYILLLIAIAGGYYFLALWVGQHVFGAAQISEVGQLYQIVIALALAFAFQPIRIFFEKLTDRIFYKNHYDTQKVVNGFTNILVSERDIEPLLQRSISFLCNQLHIDSGEVVVFDNGKIFATASCHDKKLDDANIYKFAQSTTPVIIAEYLSDEDPGRIIMEKSNTGAIARLVSQDEQIGMLILGDKLSGDIYSNQDVGALEIISQELAVAIQNARAYRLLQDAQEQLKQTDQMKSEFIALSSHNLRTPITTIRLATEMLGQAKSPEEIGKYIQMLTGVSSELSALVEELLTISSLEAGKRYESFETATIQDIVQPLIDPARANAQSKGLQFSYTAPEASILIKANTTHLRMTFRSLLDNAIKFTSSGSVSINITLLDHSCAIKVTDTGIGIKPEELKNLFTKFHRGTDFMQYDYTGAGVGLYLTKLIVDEHGGQIVIDSTPGQGTTATVTLPAVS